MARSRLDVLVSHVAPELEPEPCSQEDADTAEVDAVGATAFLVNGWRAMQGGFVPCFEGASEKGMQYIKEWQEIRETTPTLFYDSFSHIFFNEYTWKIFEGFVANEKYDKMDDKAMIMGLRTVFVDNQVQEAIAAGTRQVVYLGSGLDTRALRLHSPDVATFEVDRKPVLGYKVKKLAEAGFPVYPAKLIMADYFEIDLFAELQKAGVDLAAPTLFVWEGNSMYIPTDMSKQLLQTLFEKVPKAKVVFDSVAGEGNPDIDNKLEVFYEIMNEGKVMFPGRGDAEFFAGFGGAKVLKSISIGAYGSELLGSPERVHPYLLNKPDRVQSWEEMSSFGRFNVIAL